MKAIFEGWLMKPGSKIVIAPGPFEVEIFKDETSRRTRYCARLLPTKQPFMEGSALNLKPIERKTGAEVKGCIEVLFNHKVRDWVGAE